MTKQEIIAELRDLTNEKAFSKLITLSETIGELNSYVHESGEPSKAWQLVALWNQLLNMDVELCDFVPCDADGKPLIEPTYTRSKASHEGGFEYQKSIILHNEAQKNVIFEGWRIAADFTNNERLRVITLHLKEGIGDAKLYHDSVEFYYDEFSQLIDICVDFEGFGAQLEQSATILNLAAETTKSPLRLK